jgi:hypothetical protein
MKSVKNASTLAKIFFLHHKEILLSLRKFGLNDKLKSLIVAVFDATPSLLAEIQTLIHGTLTPINSLLSSVTNTKQILQVCKEIRVLVFSLSLSLSLSLFYTSS